MNEYQLIQLALENAGYDCEANANNLIKCFRDYVDDGAWSNLDLNEVDDMLQNGELTVSEMCKALIRL